MKMFSGQMIISAMRIRILSERLDTGPNSGLTISVQNFFLLFMRGTITSKPVQASQVGYKNLR
jgi:hypothetical protein